MARSCTGGGNFPTMAALSEDATADLRRRVAELERQLETAVIERETAVDRQTASAMDNFRLQSELRAALERQGASAEILRAIANTSGDADQALQQIAETTARLFGAPSVTMVLVEGESWGKTINYGASSERVRARVAVERPRFGGDNLPGTVLRENRQIHIPDLDHIDPGMAHWPVMAARAEGTRTVAATPLRHEARPIGVLIVYRDGLAPFTDGELALQQSFRRSGGDRDRECAAVQRNARRRCPGKPPPPTSCASSAGRRPTCNRCSTPSCRPPSGCCNATALSSCAARGHGT